MNKYLMEALDSYPYDLTQTLESLEYALSYDAECAYSLCLYGRLYEEQLYDYNTAIYYYEQALKSDIYAVVVYPHFISALLKNEEYEKARKAIDFALKVKGIDKRQIIFLKAKLFEHLKKYEKALKTLKESEVYTFDNDHLDSLKETRTRILEKNNRVKATKKKGVKKNK